MTKPIGHGEPGRCTAADLRLQWSSAYSRRSRDPEALARLQQRIDATLDALTEELSAATTPATCAALVAEIAEVRDVDADLLRMGACDTTSMKRNG